MRDVDRLIVRRALAFLVDRGVSLLIAIAAALASRALAGAGTPRAALALLVLGLVLSTAYSYVRDAVGGRSIGRRLLRLRVVDRDSRLPIGALRSLKRELPLHVFPLSLAELWLGRKAGQRLGDRWAKTVVVDAGGAAR